MTLVERRAWPCGREYRWVMSLSDEVRIALDGKWRHVREQSRVELAELDLAFDHDLTMDEARERTFAQLKELVPTGVPAAGFKADHGGGGDPGMAVTGIEMLAQFGADRRWQFRGQRGDR